MPQRSRGSHDGDARRPALFERPRDGATSGAGRQDVVDHQHASRPQVISGPHREGPPDVGRPLRGGQAELRRRVPRASQ